MLGLYSVLDMAKVALLAQQANMAVVGHNISNVSTPGYSRQRLEIATSPSIITDVGQMGTGVRALGVRREYDVFIGAQINIEKQLLGNWQAQDYGFLRVEGLFNESSESGLSGAMDEFWNAWQAAADNPSGFAERVNLISLAETMARDFNSRFNELFTIQSDIDANIKGIVDEINILVDQIAEVNEKIAWIETAGDVANDFRDERVKLLDELGGMIGFSSFEDSSGQVSVLMESGNPLVQSNKSWHLGVRPDATNNGFYDIGWNVGSGTFTDVTGGITRGELSGLLEMRDTKISGYIDNMDKLAAGIINEINKLHYYGYGLDGSTENNFFNPLSVKIGAPDDNTGGASISAGPIYDNTVLTLDDYEIRFTGAATFEIYNVTDSTQVTTARINSVVDVDGSFAYVDPTDIEFEGIRVAITDGATGPANGDIFTVNTTGGAAGNMTVNSVLVSDVNKIAASEDSAGNDNLNAIAIAVLRDGNYMDNNTRSFSNYYNGIIGKIGVDSSSASRSLLYKQNMVDQLNMRRESVSGVNLDEELANLMIYQQAYTASARMISLVGEMLDELMNII
jgi:flagellar hook-associated protein 1 FlgK